MRGNAFVIATAILAKDPHTGNRMDSEEWAESVGLAVDASGITEDQKAILYADLEENMPADISFQDACNVIERALIRSQLPAGLIK